MAFRASHTVLYLDADDSAEHTVPYHRALRVGHPQDGQPGLHIAVELERPEEPQKAAGMWLTSEQSAKLAAAIPEVDELVWAAGEVVDADGPDDFAAAMRRLEAARAPFVPDEAGEAERSWAESPFGGVELDYDKP